MPHRRNGFDRALTDAFLDRHTKLVNQRLQMFMAEVCRGDGGNRPPDSLGCAFPRCGSSRPP